MGFLTDPHIIKFIEGKTIERITRRCTQITIWFDNNERISLTLNLKLDKFVSCDPNSIKGDSMRIELKRELIVTPYSSSGQIKQSIDIDKDKNGNNTREI